MKRLKKGDNVVVIAGKEKGRRGTILSLIPNKGLVIVEGLNLYKKHVKPNPSKGIEGGISRKEVPINSSNVALYDPDMKKACRVGFRKNVDKENLSRKVRYFKSSSKPVKSDL